MWLSNCFILLAVTASWIQAEEQLVWLEDINNDVDRRHLELGLPDNLAFKLNRAVGTPLKLSLTENKRLNANAPMYETVMVNGKQKLVKKNSPPIQTTKFYQDLNTGAAVMIKCTNQPLGACQRSLEGSLNIDGEAYAIQPVSSVHTARSSSTSNYVPHTIRKVEEQPPFPGKDARGVSLTSFKRIDDDKRGYNDGRVPEGEKRGYNDGRVPEGDKRGYNDGIVPDEPVVEATKEDYKELLRELVALDELEVAAERMLAESKRTKRQTQTTFDIEIVAVVDPIFWDKYYQITSASGGMTREEATEYAIREKLALIINGVSLRYQSIEDASLKLFTTISQFIVYQEIGDDNPLSTSVPVYTINGRLSVDSDTYLANTKTWVTTLADVEHDDHYMVFTGYDLYYGGGNTGVLGVAYLGGACGVNRVSVQEDADYFRLTSVAAHELGHNLNADHDGEPSASSCPNDTLHIMNPSVTSFGPNDDYSINPWRFSSCSITAFKNFIGTGRCFTDVADAYDQQEWNLHNSKQPGELYSLDQQCQMIRGQSSSFCSGSMATTDESVCLTMLCDGGDGFCYYYTAARGTPCGQPSDDKWCVEGACVKRTVIVTTNRPTTTQAPTTTTTTTQAPTTTTTTQAPMTTTTTQAPTTTTTTTRAPTTTTTTQAPTTTTTTQAPTTTTTTQAPTTTTTAQATTTTQPPTTTTSECTDSGWRHWSCERVSNYFYARYHYRPSYWCQDRYWSVQCCAFCAEATQTTTTTTTTEAPQCHDIGYNGWTCSRFSRFLSRVFRIQPDRWCQKETWRSLCCQYCSDYI